VQLLVVLAGAGALATSRGAERQRAAWAVASFGILFAAAIVQIVLDTIVPTTDMDVATQAAVNVVAILAPVGLTYSVLSRRLLDIGFALNRAAVFSAVSLIVVGGFIAIEWALGNWLQNLTRVTSTLVSLALAIGLGFSIKALHAQVEHAMDHVFFRKRHAQEKALLRFAREAPYVTDAAALVRRTGDEIREHAGASRVTIYRPADGAFAAAAAPDGVPASVGENDPALVSMRATNGVVDLHRTASALSGEYAFPMIARGLLIGVVVCGPKRSGDPYAPDEVATLAEVAREVGTALDAHTAHRGDASADLLALQLEVAALRDDVRELLAAMRAPEPT
jgi:K+-sensing histidine kinase KdpD